MQQHIGSATTGVSRVPQITQLGPGLNLTSPARSTVTSTATTNTNHAGTQAPISLAAQCLKHSLRGDCGQRCCPLVFHIRITNFLLPVWSNTSMSFFNVNDTMVSFLLLSEVLEPKRQALASVAAPISVELSYSRN